MSPEKSRQIYHRCGTVTVALWPSPCPPTVVSAMASDLAIFGACHGGNGFDFKQAEERGGCGKGRQKICGSGRRTRALMIAALPALTAFPARIETTPDEVKGTISDAKQTFAFIYMYMERRLLPISASEAAIGRDLVLFTCQGGLKFMVKNSCEHWYLYSKPINYFPSLR